MTCITALAITFGILWNAEGETWVGVLAHLRSVGAGYGHNLRF